MKVKTAVLSTVIVAVLAAMEVKAADKLNEVSIHEELNEVSIHEEHDEQRSYLANLMSRMPRMPRMRMRMRMPRMLKLAVAAGILLIASYELVNYLIDVPIVPADAADADAVDVFPLLKFPTTTITNATAKESDEFDEFDESVVPIVPIAVSKLPDVSTATTHVIESEFMRKLRRRIKLKAWMRRMIRMRNMRMNADAAKKRIGAPPRPLAPPPLEGEEEELEEEELVVVSAHAQRKPESKWIAAGLSSLALIFIFAMALILWNLKNPKKTGRKKAPFSK